jgi:hypothetical protein
MKTLEEVTYEVGRASLADQESVVAGVRQRTGTLLAAHALVASFLGAAAIRVHGVDTWAWVAIVCLVGGLVVAAIILSPWELKFAIDATDLYGQLFPQASAEAGDDTLGWLAAAGFGFQQLRDENSSKVKLMARLSTALGALMVVQTLLWLAALGLD